MYTTIFWYSSVKYNNAFHIWTRIRTFHTKKHQRSFLWSFLFVPITIIRKITSSKRLKRTSFHIPEKHQRFLISCRREHSWTFSSRGAIFNLPDSHFAKRRSFESRDHATIGIAGRIFLGGRTALDHKSSFFGLPQSSWCVADS